MSMLSELVSITGTFLGAWGVILTIMSNKKNRELKSITWGDLQSATKYFWKKLNSMQFQPNFIICPGQKGGIIAQLISDFYEEEIPIITGCLESRSKQIIDDENFIVLTTTKWNVYIPRYIQSYEKKQTAKILIVDDFAMSGDFLTLLKSKLLEYGYVEENICSCVAAVTQVALAANKGPNFYWKIVDDSDFYFPWGKAK